MTINEEILDRSIRHMVWLERFKSSEVKRMIALLNKVDKDLTEQIATRLVNIEQRGYDLGKTTTARLKALQEFIRENRDEAAAALYEAQKQGLFDFVQYEMDFQARIVQASAASAGAEIAMARPALSQLKAAVTSQPFQGRLLRDWYKDLSTDTARKVSDAVRIGIVEGQTTDQIVRRIRGTRARQFKDGVLEVSRNHAAAIVRTSTAHVAQRAKDELYAENADILEGVKWVSTLDSRTCFVAGTLVLTPDGKRPIEQIQKGDIVIGGSRKPRFVMAAKKANTKKVVRLTLSNGEVLECTPDHLFLTPSGWVEAQDLSSGLILSEILK